MSTLEEFKFPDEKESPSATANEVAVLAEGGDVEIEVVDDVPADRKSTRLNSSHT